MKTAIKLVLSLAIIIATMYGEYYWPILGALVAMLLLPCSFIIKGDVGGLQILTASIVYCSSFFYLGMGPRVIHHRDSVAVVTPFYPIGQVLGTGISLDTLRLARCFEEEFYGEFKVKSCDMFILTAADSTQTLFSELDVVLKGTDLSFTTYQTTYGEINVCQYTDEKGIQHVWDLYGQDANAKNYSPHIIEYRDYYDTY